MFEDEDFPPPAPLKPLQPKPETPKGARSRYEVRIKHFEADGKPAPKLRHWGFWVLHNCLVHPLLGIFPNEKTVELHEVTSKWLNHRKAHSFYRIQVPEIENPVMWVVHNTLSHMAIGLVPSKTAFDLHDWTAELMEIPGWV